MVKKPRENRVPIMMSDDELTAIDDWRFANRVATRSDAVRRLCQTGLGFDRKADEIEAAALNISSMIETMALMLRDGAIEDTSSLNQLVVDALRSLMELSEAQAALAGAIGSATIPARHMRQPGDISERLERHRAITELIAGHLQEISGGAPDDLPAFMKVKP